MNDSDRSMTSVEELISEVEKSFSSIDGNLSKNIENEISVRPDWAIDCIKHLEDMNESEDDRRIKILFRLIDESLSQIRYRMDRKDKQGDVLLIKVQEALIKTLPTLPSLVRFGLNQILFDSKLSFDIVEHGSRSLPTEGEHNLDIMPQLPELLEKLRRENTFKTCFELYELILSQIQFESTMTQLSIIAEMASSKKAIAHELAVLMLLHSKPGVRKRVSDVLYAFSDNRVFTSIDLRRLIVIRNWVPVDERRGIDRIISHLRKNKLSPAPYPPFKSSRIFGSSMDGAGALSIMMEVKKKNQRKIVGFILKIDVGIRDLWVMHKAPCGYFDQIIKEQKEQGVLIKPVSKTYVNKVVRHFLSEATKNEIVPEAAFIEIAELFGADNWQPQPLSFIDEVNRLKDNYKDEWDQEMVEKSLQRSGLWHLNESIADSWFELGDAVEKSVVEASKIHKKDQSKPFNFIFTDCLMSICLDKWKTIFLVTCLWMRSTREDKLCYDLCVVLHCLMNEMPVSSIPFMCNVAIQSTATALRREMY